MPDAELTVLICTWNRAELLRATLSALTRVNAPDTSWNLVIVDNNSTDHTRDVVLECAERFVVPVRYVFESKQGRSCAMNRGLAEIRSPLVAFTDDDVEPGPMWLRSLHRALTNGDCDYVGGPVHPMWEAPPPAWFEQSGSVLWGTLAILDYGDEPFVFEERRRVPLGVNVAMRRTLLERVGPFNEAFGRGGGRAILGQELPEFLARTRASGARGRYLPDMLVKHHVPSRRLQPDYWRRWWYGKGVSRARLEQLHPVTELGLDLRNVPSIAGVPRFLFGSAARDALGWVYGSLAGNRGRRVACETQLCYFAGQVTERYRTWRASKDMSRPRHPACSPGEQER